MGGITGLATNVVYRGEQYNNRAYVWNGRNRMRKYDGENWRNSGIVEAAFTPTVAVQGTGLSGTYKYLVVPVNENHRTFGAKFVAGQPMSSATITVNNQGVRVGNIPATADDAQVTHWHIFRNKDGFYDTNVEDEVQDFWKVASIAVGTTTYDDTTADDALTPIDTSFRHTFPPTFKYGAIYGERLFGGGFDPITTGTATVNATTTLIDFSGVSLDDGVVGCLFQVDGDDAVYNITALNSTTQVTLNTAYVGALSGGSYSIFQDNSLVYFSEFRDPDSWGIDGPYLRNRLAVGGPHSKLTVTGLYEFRGFLYVFTKTSIYRISGVGEDQRAIRITPNPIYNGYGCVSGDAITSYGNTMYFLSMQGPVAYDGFSEPKLIGANIGRDWLSGLNASKLNISCAWTNGYLVKFAVPQTGETENSLIWTYDIQTGTWWKETRKHPTVAISLNEDSNSLPAAFYGQGKFLMQDELGTTDGVPSGTTTGSPTSGTTTTLTDTGASFYNTNDGLAERYLDVYKSDNTLRWSARITSNTGTVLTFPAQATAPQTTDTYYVGAILMHWTSPTFRYPGRYVDDMKLHLGYDLQSEGTASTIWKTDIYRDSALTNLHSHTVDEVEKSIPIDIHGPEYAFKLESRIPGAKIAIRDYTLGEIVKEDNK